ncbi:zinc finger protein 501-like isoform X1 [Drosophila pseudoobscura]|uniref:Zinc finger protein 501-like isoform X1 n=1 Tax=Drosophila pseudoobscura pseudoobscura TaxID=46245 RepID=A0A6I8VY82_DROPS|nr:zinc finger protein 501-like isoform X1 [Drosophila pseudoobscura]
MEEMCRVCMVKSGVFVNIFDETQKWDTCIADMIAQCTGYVVRRGDSLPEKICPPCLEDAVNAFNLKKSCEQSHRLYFPVMEPDVGEDRYDNLEDEDFEILTCGNEQSKNCKADEMIQKDDVDEVYRFKCPHCPKSYMRKSCLPHHIRTHTDDRPYKCSFCSKSFPHKCRLDAHTRIHTGDRRYTCSDCSKSFQQKSHLIDHTRIHTGERPYKCNHCSMTFSRAGVLSDHIRSHTGDQRYQCSHCMMPFNNKQIWITHVRTHTGERPFSCSQCSKSFNQKHHLSEHILTHTEEKRYTCSYCTNTFKQKSYLRKHIRSHTCSKWMHHQIDSPSIVSTAIPK